MQFGELVGQGWLQIGELSLAFVLSALIGLEREFRQKSAGWRTHTLVGLAAALVMLISKYGFMDILANDRIVLDPSRVAAQIVSGIGFIGGGLIFVRRDSVRGLTTAAIVWLTAAVGMACGAGLPILALFVTGCHFVVVFCFPHIARQLPKSRWTPSLLQVSSEDREGILQNVLAACTEHDFAVSQLRVDRSPARSAGDLLNAADPGVVSNADLDAIPAHARTKRIMTVSLEVQGTRSVSRLAARLSDIDGVVAVSAGDGNVPSE